MRSLPSEQKGLISLVGLGGNPDCVFLGRAASRPEDVVSQEASLGVWSDVPPCGSVSV